MTDEEIAELAAIASTGPHPLQTYKLGGGDGKTEYFDYITLDSPTRRLFLSHGTEVKVVHADTGKVLGHRSRRLCRAPSGFWSTVPRVSNPRRA